jgi:hypothetical protein
VSVRQEHECVGRQIPQRDVPQRVGRIEIIDRGRTPDFACERGQEGEFPVVRDVSQEGQKSGQEVCGKDKSQSQP